MNPEPAPTHGTAAEVPPPRRRLAAVPRGKVGRVPSKVRAEVNRRLLRGEKATVILPWLNAQPEVRALLARDYGGLPVTAANLSLYKTGEAYRAWVTSEEALRLRFAPAERAMAAWREAQEAPPTPPELAGPALRVERAEASLRPDGRPALSLVVEGQPATVDPLDFSHLALGVVFMRGGPPHAAALLRLPGREGKKIADFSDDAVIVEVARRVFAAWRKHALAPGPLALPTVEEARAAHWSFNPDKGTLRRKKGGPAR